MYCVLNDGRVPNTLCGVHPRGISARSFPYSFMGSPWRPQLLIIDPGLASRTEHPSYRLCLAAVVVCLSGLSACTIAVAAGDRGTFLLAGAFYLSVGPSISTSPLKKSLDRFI